MTTHDLARKLLERPDVALMPGPIHLIPAGEAADYVAVEDDNWPECGIVEAFAALRERVSNAYDGVDVLEFMREVRGDG